MMKFKLLYKASESCHESSHRNLEKSRSSILQPGCHLLHATRTGLVNVPGDPTMPTQRSCSPHSPFRRLLGFFSTLIPRHHIWFPLSSRAAPSHYPRILFLNLFSSLFTHIPSMSPSSTMALNPIYTIRTLKCNSPALTSILTFGLKFPIT